MSPEELLAQIATLMQEYLALGPDTPAFDVVSAAMPEIEAAAGGGGAPEPGGAPPPDGGGMMPPPPPGEEGMDLDGLMAGPSTPPGSLEDASAMAMADMAASKKKKKGSKAAY